MKINKILIFIILLGGFLRIFYISSFPPSLNWDEVSHGYNAYSILKNGTDEWGEPYPIIFRAYGDYKLPVYIYTTVISVASFGLNDFAVRLPSALAGILSIVFVYLLSKILVKKESVSLLSALFFAIEPWNLFQSRVALEANLALFLIVSGVYFWIDSINKKNNYLIISAILLSLSVWTYNSARIFTPILIFTLSIIFREELFVYLKKKLTASIISIFLIFIFLGMMFFQLISSEGTARYENVKIINEGSINEIINLRNNSTLPDLVDRIAFNKATFFALKFTENYLSHFNINYLFKNGGDNYQFNIQNHGLLYSLDFGFVIIGAVYLLLNERKNKNIQLLIVWALIGPIPASLVREAPHALRNIVSLPVIFIFLSVGLVYFLNVFREQKKLLFSGLIIIYILMFVRYVTTALDYRMKYSQSWQYGQKELANFVINNYEKYDKFIITKKYGEPHEFLLFYTSWNPEKYIKDPQIVRFYQTSWYWVDRFDKFYFTNEWDIPSNQSMRWELESGENINIDGDVVLITSPGVYPENWQVIDEIRYLDGSVAYQILIK